MTTQTPQSSWGSSYRLVAAEKWRQKSAAMGSAVTVALVEYSRPAPGMHALDVATGTGEPGISIASRVAPNGQVTALDLSPDLLKIAEERARQRRLSNFHTQQGDAHALPFPDQSFDLTTCRFGVMFFADCEQAVRQIHRVLKPGCRACFLAWGRFEQPYWASTMGIVAKHVGGPVLEPGRPNPFKFGEPGSLSAVLRRAGFADVQEEPRIVPWVWPGTAEEVWEYARSVSVPFHPLLERVPENKWDEINAEVLASIRRYSDGSKIDFGAEVILASGTRKIL